MQPKYRKICLLAAVGIVLLASHCNTHQMNISNTWTLPQDGFTVFYRFFRDKISWYEADAVCQFHHANLVTVDNGVKYDASRAYLNDLNVTENVWIGLMRSQNSDRFMWSNSKILDREFGYWAEQIPSSDSPLCAVVDPMRDYRWHSLRCGGPDVASFLCEMEAPEWATECLIRALPSLSIQYLADSATIELSRDCGAEGMKRLTCNGKQDQDVIQRELMCMFERETITSDNEMKSTIDEQPSIDDERSHETDNLESNSIDRMANQIESSVGKQDEKLNFDDVMVGDAPSISSQEEFKSMKSVKKIASEKPLKNQPKQMRKLKDEQRDELMLGDQAVVGVPVEEILPHVKKVIINDVSRKPEEIVTTPVSVVEIQRTTSEGRMRRETDTPVKSNISAPTTEPNAKSVSDVVASNAPQKEVPSGHFIPPMLLVQHQNSTVSPPLPNEEATKSVNPFKNGTIVATTQQPTQLSTISGPTSNSNDSTTIDSANVEGSATPFPASSISPISSTTPETTTATVSKTTHYFSPHEYTKTNMMRPHAPKFGGEISYHANPNLPSTMRAPVELTSNDTNPVTEGGNFTESTLLVDNATSSAGSDSTTIKSIEQTTEATQITNETATATDAPHLEVAKRGVHSAGKMDKHKHKQDELHKINSHQQKHVEDHAEEHADFTNSNVDFHKPNRKRILTKPEVHSYIQKIFG